MVPKYKRVLVKLSGEALSDHQSPVAERKIPNTPQDLHRLDGGDHPARDRPLRGDHNIKQRKTPHLTGEDFLRSCAEI